MPSQRNDVGIANVVIQKVVIHNLDRNVTAICTEFYARALHSTRDTGDKVKGLGESNPKPNPKPLPGHGISANETTGCSSLCQFLGCVRACGLGIKPPII